jgi:hypothetical protein
MIIARFRHFGEIFSFIFTPTCAFALSFFGYYTFAGYANAFLPDSNTGGIIIRCAILGVIIGVYLVAPVRHGFKGLSLLPVAIFFLIYLLRLVDNIYFLKMDIPPGSDLILLIFIFGGIVPAAVLAAIHRGISDDQLTIVVSCLCVVFLAGLSLNINTLVDKADSRMALDKVNAISMGHTAAAFVLYYCLVFSKSKRLMIEAFFAVPILLLIIVYARSRGAYIAGAGALCLYLILLKGSKRIWMLLGLAAIGAAVGYLLGPEYYDIVLDRLKQTDIDADASTYGRYLAFNGAWQQFNDDFAFGRYAIELTTGNYPHNIYLESLMAVGFLGTIPFAVHLVCASRAAIGIIRSQGYPISAVLIAVLFIRDAIAASGSGGLWSSTGFWITSILVIAFWYGRKLDQRVWEIKRTHLKRTVLARS